VIDGVFQGDCTTRQVYATICKKKKKMGALSFEFFGAQTTIHKLKGMGYCLVMNVLIGNEIVHIFWVNLNVQPNFQELFTVSD
jgi:hypothetical protein